MKRLLPLILLVFIINTMMAQPPGKEGMRKMKIGYITTELDLTTDEAQKFWPVFNAFDNERMALKEQEKSIADKIDAGGNLSDSDYKNLIDQLIQLRKKAEDLEATYKQKFLDVLPAAKVAKLYILEEKFRKDLMRRIRERREGDMGPPR